MSIASQYRVKFCQDELLSGAVHAASYPPEGRLLALADSEGNLIIVDSAAGVVIHHAFIPGKENISVMLWTPHLELFYGRSDGTVASVQVSIDSEKASFGFANKASQLTAPSVHFMIV